MGNLLTFDLGLTGPGAPLIQQLYTKYAANPPAGYTVLAHNNIGDLCNQVADLGQMLQVVEVVSHGNPMFLGQIMVPTVPELATALVRASPAGSIYLSGCNTGTWNSGNTFCISSYLASMAPCKVYGSMGYVNTGLFATGNVQCSPNNWGQDPTVYQGAITAIGGRVFSQKPRATMPRYMIPYQPGTPVAVSSLPSAMQSLLTSLLSPLADTPAQGIPVNPRMAPDIRVSFLGEIYDLYNNASVAYQESSQKSWHLSMSLAQQQRLQSLWIPQAAGVAVVAAPTAAPTPAESR